MGADRSVGAGWRLGAALGYTSGTLMVDDRSSKSGIDSYSALLYGGKAFEVGIDHLNWLLGAAYTWHDISSERRVSLPGLDQTLRADYGASTSQFFTELGYAMRFTGVTLEPFAGVAWSDLRTRGFSETGGRRRSPVAVRAIRKRSLRWACGPRLRFRWGGWMVPCVAH